MIHVTPIPRLTSFTTPTFTLGTSNVAGDALTAVASNSTILTYDATDPANVAASAAVGSASTAARRDHVHSIGSQSKLKLVGTAVASSSATVTVTGLDSTYDTYFIAMSDLIPATDDVIPWFRVGDSSGIDSGASDYRYHSGDVIDVNSNYNATNSTGDSKIVLSGAIGNSTGEGYGGFLVLNRPADGTSFPNFGGVSSGTSGTSVSRGGHQISQRTSAITLDRVQFLFASGVIASGRLTVWGFAHA